MDNINSALYFWDNLYEISKEMYKKNISNLHYI